jgi:RNA polymerase sigma-70 factor (ECF subfamily)
MSGHDPASRARRASEGDADALQHLIVEYHGPLHRLISRRVGAQLRRYVDADDVLQQAYITAFRSVGRASFDGPAGFYKWLERIALNRLKDVERDLRRHKRNIGRRATAGRAWSTSHPGLIERVCGPQSTPSRNLAKREAAAAILSSLARLTDDQREVVRMRVIEGMPAAEVAAELGKTEGAVHMLCHRGLKALREMMISITRYLSRT